MRILVFSDSHRTLGYMERKVAEYRPDKVLHLGDHEHDIEALRAEYPEIGMLAVAGNCDWGSMERAQRLVEWDGVRLLLTHGHHYGVKRGLEELVREARRQQVQAVLFGHTHRPLLEYRGSLLLLNPGPAHKSCALLEIGDGAVSAMLLDA